MHIVLVDAEAWTEVEMASHYIVPPADEAEARDENSREESARPSGVVARSDVNQALRRSGFASPEAEREPEGLSFDAAERRWIETVLAYMAAAHLNAAVSALIDLSAGRVLAHWVELGSSSNAEEWLLNCTTLTASPFRPRRPTTIIPMVAPRVDPCVLPTTGLILHREGFVYGLVPSLRFPELALSTICEPGVDERRVLEALIFQRRCIEDGLRPEE